MGTDEDAQLVASLEDDSTAQHPLASEQSHPVLTDRKFGEDSETEQNESSVGIADSPIARLQQSDEVLGATIQTPPATVYMQWEPLCDGAGPSMFFMDLLREVFIFLDTDHRGMLTPEQYSSFLDVQGYGHDRNFWRKSLKPLFGLPEEYAGDAELRKTYENFFISHVLRPRVRPPKVDVQRILLSLSAAFTDDAMSLARTQALRPAIDPEGMMPMIILKGFIDLTFIEIMKDPNAGWERLSLALKRYNIKEELGQLPREMLPDYAPTLLLETIHRIQELAKANEERQVEAQRIKMDAGMDLNQAPQYFYRY